MDSKTQRLLTMHGLHHPKGDPTLPISTISFTAAKSLTTFVHPLQFIFTNWSLDHPSSIDASPAVWNDLPPVIRSQPTLDLFKRQLKTHLFKMALNRESRRLIIMMMRMMMTTTTTTTTMMMMMTTTTTTTTTMMVMMMMINPV